MNLSALCRSLISRDLPLPVSGSVLTKTLPWWNGDRRGRQIFLAMKLMSVLLLAACIQVSARGYTQHVTIHMENAPLESVLKEIKKQTGYSFFYESGLLQPAKPVTIIVDKYSVEQTLAVCFKDQPFEYRVEENTVFIKRKDGKVEQKGGIQELTRGELIGRITNVKGEPLSGANIVVKRTGKGTVSDANGNFKLLNLFNDDFIIVSYVGYQTQSIKIGNKTSFYLVLEVANNDLDKLVVQAYGTTSKRLATGNISSVRFDEIEKHPVMNLIQVLQGQVPGAVITNVNGSASTSVKVEIRGRNTIDQDKVSEPLYIVDGVPMTILNLTSIQAYASGSIVSQGAVQAGIPSEAGAGQSQFFGINPNDIESIEVLKDADATAIYGSRGSNGVILITTKRGSAGKTHADITVFTGYSQVSRYYHLLNTEQYIAMRKEALINDGLQINLQTAPDLVAWDTTRHTDWQKYVYGGLGKRSSVQASISGGNLNTSFRASAGYDYDKDVVTDHGGNNRVSFALNLNHKTTNQKFRISWSTLYSLSKIDLSNRSASVLLPPNAPNIFDDKGKLNYNGWGTLSNLFQFGGLMENYLSKSNFLNNNISLNYEIIKGLEIGANLGYNYSLTEQTKIIPIASQNPSSNPKGSFRIGRTKFENIIFEPKVEYGTYLSKGKITALLGATIQSNKTDGLLNSGTNYTDDLLLNSINNAPSKAIVDNYAEYKYSGAFARINYNWVNKYIMNLNARRDGSSRFGPGRQFGNFGSLGSAWIFSEEKFLKKLSFLSFGKLRASYGVTGSDQIQDYQYLSLWQLGGYYSSPGSYNSVVPLNPVGFSDSLLQWEVNRKIEASIYFSFIKDKISVEVSWYRNRCNNQLVAFPTPGFSGFTTVTSNSPANVENKGWEFILNAKLFNENIFKWSIKTSVAINRNKLLSYPNFSESPFRNRLEVGKPLNIVKLLHYTGVDPQNGLYTFEDIDHNGSVTVNLAAASDDRYSVNLTPKFDGGFTSYFNYRNFDLSMFFYFRKQLGTNILASSQIPGTINNQSVDVLNHWQKIGDYSPLGFFTTRSTLNNNRFYSFSDARITDASFIRLQNLSLTYKLPEKILNKVKMTGFKVYVQGENLFVITNYKGIDPEVQSLGAMPRPRIVTAGLSCNF